MELVGGLHQFQRRIEPELNLDRVPTDLKELSQSLGGLLADPAEKDSTFGIYAPLDKGAIQAALDSAQQ